MRAEASSERQDWRTPDWFYRLLDERFHFGIDLAADSESAKCPLWLGPGSAISEDALTISWNHHDMSAFLNPPYGMKGVEPWINKAAEASRLGMCVVVLVNSRTDKPWFHRALREASEVLFVHKRLYFINADTGVENRQPTTPSVILVWHPAFRGPARVGWLPGRIELVDAWRAEHPHWSTP